MKIIRNYTLRLVALKARMALQNSSRQQIRRVSFPAIFRQCCLCKRNMPIMRQKADKVVTISHFMVCNVFSASLQRDPNRRKPDSKSGPRKGMWVRLPPSV